MPVYKTAVLGVLASAELIYHEQKIQVIWESNETIGVYYDRNNVNAHIDFISKQTTAISNGTRIIVNTRDKFRIIKSPQFEPIEYAINHGCKLEDIQNKLSKFHLPKYINNPYKLAFKILIEVTDQKFWNWINETNYYLG